ncbi:MAG: hypothetical protein R3C28_26600 [Pirellulaceae bacterium]
MTPDEMSMRQIDAYRKMTGEQRLRIGLGLFEASCDVTRQQIRNRFPELTNDEVEQRLKQRIRIGYEIQQQMELRR